MKTWSEQIDELVLAGQYSDALKFLESIESKDLSDKVSPRCIPCISISDTFEGRPQGSNSCSKCRFRI